LKLLKEFRIEMFIQFSGAKYLFLAVLLWLLLVLEACTSQDVNNASIQSTPTILNAATITNTANSIKPSISSASSKAPFDPSTVVTTLSSPLVTSTLAVPDWKYEWLQGVPCLVPCWEGVTPGKTTMQEALDSLKQNPLVAGANISLSSNSETGSSHTIIDWDWTKISSPSPGGYIDGGSELASSKVVRITPSYNAPYKLGDVIKMYGEPTYVVADYRKLENDSYYAVAITFSAQGLFLSYTAPANKKPTINADLTFEPPTARLIFFVPGAEAFPKIPFYDGYNKYRKPWSGYNTFDFYCRDLPGSGNYCKYA